MYMCDAVHTGMYPILFLLGCVSNKKRIYFAVHKNLPKPQVFLVHKTKKCFLRCVYTTLQTRRFLFFLISMVLQYTNFSQLALMGQWEVILMWRHGLEVRFLDDYFFFSKVEFNSTQRILTSFRWHESGECKSCRRHTYDQFHDTLHTPSTFNFRNGDQVLLRFQAGRFLIFVFNRRLAGTKFWNSLTK